MTFEKLKECVLNLREALKCVSQAEQCCDVGERKQILQLRLHTLMVFGDHYAEYLDEKKKRNKEGGAGGRGRVPAINSTTGRIKSSEKSSQWRTFFTKSAFKQLTE